jgi:spore coat protein CotH
MMTDKNAAAMCRRRLGSAWSITPLLLLVSVSAWPAEREAATEPPKPAFEPNLPLFFLSAKGQIDKVQKTPCTLAMTAPGHPRSDVSNAWTGTLKLHGGVSAGFPKRSFAITLASPTRLLDLRESAHWVLNAAFIDRSFMRHKLSYDLFRSLDKPDARRFAVASRFVEVFFNGEYHGVYLLMERVDGFLLGLRRFGSNEMNHACIYKAVDHAANFSQPGHAGYEQREPDALVKGYWRPLDEFNQFASRAREAEFFDPQTGIGSQLDLGNAIDFYLLVLLTSNLDGITKNFMIARDVAREDLTKPRFFFVPWDYDGTFGRNWDASAVAPDLWLSNHLFDRLMEDRTFRERLTIRWKGLREREFSASTIQTMIEANVRALGEAASRNAARWRSFAGHYPDGLSFADDVAQMKTWIEARIQWLDGEFKRRTAAP